MKKNNHLQALQHAKQYHSALNQQSIRHHKRHLTLAILVCSYMGLTGCQAVNSAINNQAVSTQNLQRDNKQEGQFAKQTLQSQLHSMTRQSFSYQTDIKISNGNRRDALANATPEQLANAKRSSQHCDHVHDNAYAEVLKQAKNDGISVQDVLDDVKNEMVTPYTQQLTEIKESYIQCYTTLKRYQKDSDPWAYIYDELQQREILEAEESEDGHKDSNEDSSDIESNDHEANANNTNVDNVVNENDDADLETESEASESEIEVENTEEAEAEPEFLAHYDNKHTALDVKKANLLNAYLLQPSSAQIVGTYRPLLGQFTLLPTVSYQARNLNMSVNQPIYINLRQGDIYLWADSFALLVSEYLDDELGLAWQNKWLKISLKDGSLPDDFAKNFIQAYLDALEAQLQSEPDTNFTYIVPANGSELTSLDSLDNSETIFAQTPASYVIEHQQNAKDIEQSNLVFYRHLYHELYAKYPELFDENLDAKADMDELSHVGVDESTENKPEKKTALLLTAKDVAEVYLAMVKKQAELTDDDTEENVSSHRDDNNDSENLDADAKETHMVMAEDKNSKAPISSEKAISENAPKVLNQYGFSAENRLLWWRYQIRINSKHSYLEDTDNGEGMVVTALTQFQPISQRHSAFPNLPANAQMPNSANSVNIIEYAQTLKSRYERGEGETLGRILFGQENTDDLETVVNKDGTTCSEKEALADLVCSIETDGGYQSYVLEQCKTEKLADDDDYQQQCLSD
ncbi:hypothetical protein [Psychrobacter sp. I-STPA6b]|uniref:hypothetical protein n=1 Tax=Psychrobacter sp. I-STPA6b TaxID=2585718 RepID=UPI001D0CC062|nr:hypothetical protein [Psychrobacter sp. I-STPA6b]